MKPTEMGSLYRHPHPKAVKCEYPGCDKWASYWGRKVSGKKRITKRLCFPHFKVYFGVDDNLKNTHRYKNPGAAYHQNRSIGFQSLSESTKGSQSKGFWMRKTDQDYDAEESEFLGMKNPISKKFSWLPIILIAGIGYLWWKNRTQ